MTPPIAQVEPPPSEPPFGLAASLLFAAAGLALMLYIVVVLYRESGETERTGADADAAEGGAEDEERRGRAPEETEAAEVAEAEN